MVEGSTLGNDHLKGPSFSGVFEKGGKRLGVARRHDDLVGVDVLQCLGGYVALTDCTNWSELNQGKTYWPVSRSFLPAL